MIGLLLLLAGCWLAACVGTAWGVLHAVGWQGWWDRW